MTTRVFDGPSGGGQHCQAGNVVHCALFDWLLATFPHASQGLAADHVEAPGTGSIRRRSGRAYVGADGAAGRVLRLEDLARLGMRLRPRARRPVSTVRGTLLP